MKLKQKQTNKNGSQKEKERQILVEIITKNILKIIKNNKAQIQEIQRLLNKITRNIITKFLKVKDKGKIFQAAKRKGNIKCSGTKIKISSRYFCQKVGKPEIRVTTLEY